MKTLRVFRPSQPQTETAEWFERFDWLHRVDPAKGVPASGPVLPGSLVVQDLRTGAWFHGVEATRRVCAEVPVGWPAWLLLSVPVVARWYENYRMEAGIRTAA